VRTAAQRFQDREAAAHRLDDGGHAVEVIP
jgi:hypothetical protein